MMYQLAYLDPGTGSFMLQMLAGGLFGGLFFVKRFFRRAKNAIFHRDDNAIISPKPHSDIQ